jgi:hypothetical protein
MSYQVLPTTAENIISVIDAVLLKNDGCDSTFVSSFVEIPQSSADNALEMAVQLTFLRKESPSNLYFSNSLFVHYLVTNKEKQKATIFRLFLENYPPYQLFKHRLTITDSVLVSAEQIKAFYGLPNHRDEIKDTLTSLGTYSQSLVSEGAGLFQATEYNTTDITFLDELFKITEDREKASLDVIKLLGDKAYQWIDHDSIFNPLVSSYIFISNVKNDPRAPILYAGNAYETFLIKFADHHSISLAGMNGINAKIEGLSRAHHINTKHKNIGKYIGHIRNACDHGADPEIGVEWNISENTSKEYVLVCISSIGTCQ